MPYCLPAFRFICRSCTSEVHATILLSPSVPHETFQYERPSPVQQDNQAHQGQVKAEQPDSRSSKRQRWDAQQSTHYFVYIPCNYQQIAISSIGSPESPLKCGLCSVPIVINELPIVQLEQLRPSLLPKAEFSASSRALRDALIQCRACVVDMGEDVKYALLQAVGLDVPDSGHPLPQGRPIEHLTSLHTDVLRFVLRPESLESTMSKVLSLSLSAVDSHRLVHVHQ